VLRFEAVVHNTRALRCGRVLDNFPRIIDRLAAMVDRFTTTLDCVDHTFIGDGFLDQLPAPAQIGTTRVGGVDLNKPRIRAAMSAVLALSAATGGFTVAEFTAKVHTMTGHTGYTIRQAAYDLRKLRGKELITKPGRTRRYHLQPQTAGSIAALLTLREHVIAPILADVRSPRMGRKPATWTNVDRDYEKIRIDMHTLFHDLGINPAALAA
jgi:DNA-binding transcriptional ArsR family regulator